MDSIKDTFTTDCSKCLGICCFAFYFSRIDGFPCDKAIGKNCLYLSHDNRCVIHQQLAQKKYIGCLQYDCMQAGKVVCQDIYQGNPPKDKQVFMQVFYVVEALQEMLFYLQEISYRIEESSLSVTLKEKITSIETIYHLTPKQIQDIDVTCIRYEVVKLLEQGWQRYCHTLKIPSKKCRGKKILGRSNCSGKKFVKQDLRGMDFKNALLIGCDFSQAKLEGANFIGADMRNANIANTNLKNCVYLSQRQINGCKGNQNTILPDWLHMPSSW